MTITIKRQCNSNIRDDVAKLQFNAFTVSFTGPELAKFRKILNRPGKPYPAAVLEWILYRGLDAQLKEMKAIDDLYKEESA